MAGEVNPPVVILYEHALLGEGIARYVLARTGVAAAAVPAHDVEAVTSALASGPLIIVFELTSPLEQGDLATLAPNAVLIDVSTAISRGATVCPLTIGLEGIGQAVRNISLTSPLPA